MATSTHADTFSSPSMVRSACRVGRHTGHTAAMAPGYAQANLVVLPQELAYDFLVFCHRNPKPCPLLDVTDIGRAEPVQTAPGADLRTDLPGYRVYRNGELADERTDITDLWDDSMAGFLLGCSFTFEQALLDAGVPMRHHDAGSVVPMYRTNIPCTPAGQFHGEMVVSLRMVPADRVIRSIEVTARYPEVHGAPVHIGDPAAIGIADLNQPDYGDPPISEPGDVPVFWACGVTPQAIAMKSRPELMITHAPGSMFVTDVPIHQLASH
ncbi:MAG: putative hydro-lyase [Sphaerobacteraceae bacterium]|nr:MAG: putative hydro-lyase [Sphaerobacteraceae bacterium]